MKETSEGWLQRLAPASFTGLGTAEHVHSFTVVLWRRKELISLRDVPGIRTNMHKLTTEISRFLPIKTRRFWSSLPSKVGNWEDRRHIKEERVHFLNSTICLWKGLGTWLPAEAQDWTQQPKRSFSVQCFRPSFPNQDWRGLILNEQRSILHLHSPVQTCKH